MIEARPIDNGGLSLASARGQLRNLRSLAQRCATCADELRDLRCRRSVIPRNVAVSKAAGLGAALATACPEAVDHVMWRARRLDEGDSMSTTLENSHNCITGEADSGPMSSRSIARGAAREGSPSTGNPSLSPDDLLERYLDAAMTIAQRAVLSAVRSLREPRAPDDPIAALRTVERLAEALTGFAVGAAILPAAQRLRQAGGAEMQRAVQEVLATLAGPGGPSLLVVHPPRERGPRFLDDADRRPLVDELGQTLCARLVLGHSDARVVLRQLVSAAERSGAGTASTIAVAIHASLSDLVWISERLSPAVHESWSHATAVMSSHPILSGPWAPWSRRAAGLAEPKQDLTETDVVAAGFVMRIG